MAACPGGALEPRGRHLRLEDGGGTHGAGLIADGFHVHPASIRAALRAKRGPGRIFLVTDAMSTIGTDMTSFFLNGREIFRKDGRLTLADGTRYPYGGLYDYTRKDVSSTTGTLVLVVMFPNPDRSLKPGQFARVEASVGPVRPRVVVPQACVSQAQGVNSVWVVRPDSTAMYRRVIPGDTYGSMWCIDEGLIDGELVVTAGQQKLHNGMKVIPEKK